MTPAIGALVDNVSTTAVNPVNVDHLYDALIEHQLLVMPAPQLGVEQLVQLASGFGPVANDHHQYQSHPDAPEVVVLDWGGDRRPDAAEWHADMTFRSDPPFASVLQAVVVPPLGGDTLWASMYSVADALSPGLLSELAGMTAVHDMGAFRTPAYQTGGIDGLTSSLTKAGTAVHPVIDHHPVTGRPYLNVSESFTRFIIGLSAPESARLLTMLFDAINRPEHHVRVRWKPGTVAVWDNRATQHYAIADYLPNRRVMHRVTALSDRRLSARPAVA